MLFFQRVALRVEHLDLGRVPFGDQSPLAFGRHERANRQGNRREHAERDRVVDQIEFERVERRKEQHLEGNCGDGSGHQRGTAATGPRRHHDRHHQRERIRGGARAGTERHQHEGQDGDETKTDGGATEPAQWSSRCRHDRILTRS